MVKMSYNNNEPFLMAVELVQKGTFIIGVYMQETKKNYILDQLIKLIKKNKTQICKSKYMSIWRPQH